MTSPRPKVFDFSPLAHPIWWAALAVLLVNDNLLKGRGIVPGWLTGKLSDFAFLIVAPVVLAALLPLALPGRRAAALISVVGLYVAADLSRDVSDAVVATAARFGLIWKLWPDPTDLIALIVLPVSIRLLYRGGDRAIVWFRSTRERAGVVLGALACIATSDDSVYDPSFMFNATAGAETIRVTWLLSRHDGSSFADPCAQADAAALAATLNPNDLDDPREVRLERGQVALLAGPRPPGESSVGTCEPAPHGDSACVAAIMEAPGATPVLMIAPVRYRLAGASGIGPDCGGGDEPPVKRCQPMLDPDVDPGPGALTLVDDGGQRRFVAGEKIKMVPIDPAVIAARVPSPEGCRALRDEYRALLTSTACVSDADCAVRPRPPTLDDPSTCLYVNASAAQQLDAIVGDWRSACLVLGYGGCAQQPPVCRNGVCGETCPGVVVPPCEPTCPVNREPADYCYTGYACGRGGDRCTCTNTELSCAPRQPAGPGCPLSCVAN